MLRNRFISTLDALEPCRLLDASALPVAVLVAANATGDDPDLIDPTLLSTVPPSPLPGPVAPPVAVTPSTPPPSIAIFAPNAGFPVDPSEVQPTVPPGWIPYATQTTPAGVLTYYEPPFDAVGTTPDVPSTGPDAGASGSW